MLSSFLYFSQFPSSGDLSPFTIRGTNLTKSFKSEYLINCDWLQFTAVKTRSFEDCVTFVTSIEPVSRKSLHFSKCYDVRHIDDRPDDLPFAYVESDAHVSFIDKNIVIVKVQNKYLYTKDLVYYVNLICSEYDLKFKHIGRLDISMDFQKFQSKKELSIEDFMTSVASRKIIMKGSKTISNTIEPDVIGNVSYRGRRVRQISFGTRKSSAYFVMYNKSLEMRQKKFKPHILQMWEAGEFDKEIDTYRIEFSLKLKNDFVCPDTGEVINKRDLELLNKPNLNKLFKSFYKKHFVFAENDNKRFDRCTPVELFNLSEPDLLHAPLSDKKESHVHIKAQINRIVTRLVLASIQDRESLSGLDYYLSEMVHVYHLYNWFHRKWPDFKLKFIQETEGLFGSQLSFNFN